MENKTFEHLFNAYQTNQRNKIGKQVPYGITQSTFRSYTGRAKQLNEYFTLNPELQVEKLTHKHCENLYQWLTFNKNLSGIYASKTIKLLKSVLKYGYESQIITHNPIQGFITHQTKKPILYLTESELNELQQYSFASLRLQQVADLFIFQSYTGLGYCDLANFNKDWLHIHDSGHYFIKYQRQKVEGSRACIPLTRQALAILKKYNFRLPMISNVKYNSYLKEIADIVGIDKRLTTHIARKTCATLMLNKGYSIEVVSRMLGHSNIRTTQSEYAEVIEERILLESNGKINLIVTPAYQLSLAV